MANTHYAQAFVDAVRLSQQQSGRSLGGSISLSSDRLSSIRAAASEVFARIPKDEVIAPEQAQRLMERFEEMCRRRKQDLADSQRPDIIRVLVSELRANATSIKAPADALVPLTLYCGAIGPQLVREFADFGDSPGISKHAAVHSPRDPRSFLRGVQANIAGLARDPEFADFADSPGSSNTRRGPACLVEKLAFCSKGAPDSCYKICDKTGEKIWKPAKRRTIRCVPSTS